VSDPHPFHSGERDVQARVGTAGSAGRLGAGISARIPARAMEFLSGQRLAVIAGVDSARSVWASLLMGPPGFLCTRGESVLEIGALLPPGDPLASSLALGMPLGVLVIDLLSRRRLRVNGQAWLPGDGTLCIAVHEAFWNCPKYIQSRELSAIRELGDEAPIPRSGGGLEPEQRAFVEAADTLFVASTHDGSGADASHRGGLPGFVRVCGADTVIFPDYAGNGMFQTLGNFVTDGRAGLLFPDFERGRTLQLTGRASIEWEASGAGSWPGAERAVRVKVERWVERIGITSLLGRLIERSPHNPKIDSPL
jgi:predicted pyridoxine 5'-phosphate oxidase superfamily flavin-nucleotide-binding protein